MADITEDLLQTLAAGDPIAMLLVATAGKPAGRELRTIAAELLEARARIAKLEQEPPMAMIDFGVGVNWKGLHEDMQRLRAERDAARADLREAISLLRNTDWEKDNWDERYDALLAKHKETDQ